MMARIWGTPAGRWMLREGGVRRLEVPLPRGAFWPLRAPVFLLDMVPVRDAEEPLRRVCVDEALRDEVPPRVEVCWRRELDWPESPRRLLWLDPVLLESLVLRDESPRLDLLLERPEDLSRSYISCSVDQNWL